jgi:hypothetical protein
MKMAKRALVGGRSRAPMIDIGLGWALMRDNRVPGRSKIQALGTGALIIAALQVLELPIELLIAALFSVPGIGFDIAWNGIELLAGPVLVASLLLLRLAPRAIVEQVRMERGGPIPVQAPPPPWHRRR